MRADIIERYAKLPLGNICDANGKEGCMDCGIKPIDKRCKLVGFAYTVNGQPGDNLALHKAIMNAPAGAVLVADFKRYCSAGHFGEIMASACREKGIAGLVIDGGVRDANDIEALSFPVFCRDFHANGTVKETVGTCGLPIACGGVTVCPGDLIVGDRDGVVVVGAEKTEAVLKAAEAIADKEKHVLEMLKQGMTTVEIYNFQKIISEK
jgi:4-hydroxy-4-methyl-2-oxoglutarate aldolase